MKNSKNRRRTVRHEGQFKPGDPRINRKGRPPLSEAQREFRRKLHEMSPSLLKSIGALVRAKEPSVVNKMLEKLAGADSINVKLQVERELEEAMGRIRGSVPDDVYEKIVNIVAADVGSD